jgi:peptide/nickel transport system substrate-binding protein
VRDGLDEHVPGLDFTFDRDAANAMLDSLGYNNRNGAGMRLAPDGSTFEIELLSRPTNNHPRVAEIISMQLETVGLRVNVTVMDIEAFNMRVWPEMLTFNPHDYQMALLGWSAPIVQRPGAIIGIASGDLAGTGGQNLSHYANPEFDALAAEFLASIDPEERARLNEQMQRIVAADVPFITLYFADSISAVNTSHYDGWVFPKGALAMNKFSFLPR